jgi:putative lipoic acid-binding regulatory protein
MARPGRGLSSTRAGGPGAQNPRISIKSSSGGQLLNVPVTVRN